MSITATGLIKHCEKYLGTNYVYGAKLEVLTLDKYNYLYKTYGSSCVWESDRAKVGTLCVDCSGLISSYTGKVLGSYQLYERAKERGTISTLDKAPIGAILWQKGHVGVYIGNGYCIEAKGSAYGVVKSKVNSCKFTHWLRMDFITYDAELKNPYEVTKTNIVLNGVIKQVEAIQANGTNFIKLRDLADSKIIVDYDNTKKLPIIKVK